MITDDERREMAARLRDDAKGGALPYSDFLGAVAYDVGAEKDHASVLNRLADLIEPSGHECVPGECPINVRHDNDRIDRDALLAMIEEMVETFRLGAFTGEGLDAKWCRELHDKYARRIREALGVE